MHGDGVPDLHYRKYTPISSINSTLFPLGGSGSMAYYFLVHFQSLPLETFWGEHGEWATRTLEVPPLLYTSFFKK